MPGTMTLTRDARPRNTVSAEPAPGRVTETSRNAVSLLHLNAAIDAYCAAHRVKEETLAVECGHSKGNWSRMLSGRYDQSFPLPLLDVLPREIVADFLDRMRLEHDDPIAVAAEQFIQSGMRFMALARRHRPTRGRA